MKKILLLAIFLGLSTSAVSATSNYDQSLEAAAHRRIAAKIGPLRYVLRGSFGIYEEPVRILMAYYNLNSSQLKPAVHAQVNNGQSNRSQTDPVWQGGLAKAKDTPLRSSLAAIF